MDNNNSDNSNNNDTNNQRVPVPVINFDSEKFKEIKNSDNPDLLLEVLSNANTLESSIRAELVSALKKPADKSKDKGNDGR